MENKPTIFLKVRKDYGKYYLIDKASLVYYTGAITFDEIEKERVYLEKKWNMNVVVENDIKI